MDPGAVDDGRGRGSPLGSNEGTQLLGSPGSLPLMRTSWCTASVEPLDAARATPHRSAAREKRLIAFRSSFIFIS